MNQDPNYLGVPSSSFGTSGINTANLIYQAVKSKDSAASIRYDLSAKLIVIKTYAEMTIKDLGEIINSKALSPKYYGWFPNVVERKDSEGNFLIKFSVFPSADNLESTTSSKGGYIISKGLIKFLEFKGGFSGVPMPSFSMPILSSWSTNLSKERVSEVESALSKTVVSALTSIMTNAKEEFKGVWYPTDLKEFFSIASKTMPEEYWTGYASEDYFEKKGRFTFELKEGKSATDAVNVLIEGPSVLDCGNATQLAYYKAILDVIGTERFDALFSGEIFRLEITQMGITDSKSPISYFSDYTSASKRKLSGSVGARPLAIGEECHFKGLPFYANKHPMGFEGGWNVICVGDNQSGEQLFVAHGFEFPMTEREINALFIELYNLERTSEEADYIKQNPKPYLHDRHLNSFLKTYYTVPTELSDTIVEGFLIGSCRGLNSELVTRALQEEIDEKFHIAILNEKIASLI